MRHYDNTEMLSIAEEVKRRIRILLGVYFLLIISSIVIFILVNTIVVFACLEKSLSAGHIRIVLLVFLTSCSCLGLILKPLFRLFRRPKEKGKEIFRKDYPELFALIDEVVSEVHCLPPKHVRVFDECNAYAYYSSLMGYLISRRQNLSIGIPLLYGMNITELKSILSHEFGHFTQKTISTYSIANLSEFICASISRAEEEISKDDSDSFKRITRWFARLVGGIMTHQYHLIAPYNSILSRAQEYDADYYSQLVVGTDGSISALCKLEHLTKRWNDFYRIMFLYQKDENRAPNNVLEVFNEYSKYVGKDSGVDISYMIHFCELNSEVTSRIGYANDYNTHPTHEKRIEAIKSYPFVDTRWDDTPAFSLFGEALVTDIYNEVVWDIKQTISPGAVVFTGKKDITAEEVKAYFETAIPSYLESYNHYPILQECVSKSPMTSVFSNPFSKENASTLAAYYVAKDDLDTLKKVYEEHSPERKFRYLEDIYDGCNVPLDLHLNYYQPLEKKAIEIAGLCNGWLDAAAAYNGFDKTLSLYRETARVYLQLQSIYDPAQQIAEMIKKRDSFNFRLNSTTTEEMAQMQDISFILHHKTEGVSEVEDYFRIVLSSCFKPTYDNCSLLHTIARSIGVNEEQLAPVVTYYSKEDNDIKDFINVFFILYNMAESCYNKQWIFIVRELIMKFDTPFSKLD